MVQRRGPGKLSAPPPPNLRPCDQGWAQMSHGVPEPAAVKGTAVEGTDHVGLRDLCIEKPESATRPRCVSELSLLPAVGTRALASLAPNVAC